MVIKPNKLKVHLCALTRYKQKLYPTLLLPQIWIRLVIVGDGSGAHFHGGEARLQSIQLPFHPPLLLLLLPKESFEGLEFALPPSLCWEKKRKKMTSTAAGSQLVHPYLLFWAEMMSRAVFFTRREAA